MGILVDDSVILPVTAGLLFLSATNNSVDNQTSEGFSLSEIKRRTGNKLFFMAGGIKVYHDMTTGDERRLIAMAVTNDGRILCDSLLR